MATTPTQRTLAWLKKEGYLPGIVERWVVRACKRIDLFGLVDIIAIRPGEIIGVQTTSGSNVPAHVNKALAEPRLRNWLEAGGKFWIVGWSKRGARGKRKLWTEKVVELTLDSLEER